MTYKKVHRLIGFWVFLFMFMMLPGTVFVFVTLVPLSDYRTGQVVNRPIDWTMLLIGCACFGLSAWGYTRSQRYIRLRQKIYDAWEKKFDDVEFLLTHADMLDYRDGLLSLLWKGSRATAEISGAAVMRAADLYRAPMAFNPQAWFHAQMVGAWGDGGLEQPSEGVFRIGHRVFAQAEKKYPLEEFEIPAENNQASNKHVLAT